MSKIRLFLAIFFFSVILFPSSGQSVTILEKYGTILKNYSGYYIARTDTNNIYIVKLTFQVTFILQRIFFENNKLTEGDKIIFDKITNFGNVYYVFTEKGVECIDRKTNTISISDKNYILYNPNRHSRSPNGDIIFNINYMIEDKYVHRLPFNSDNSYFVESTDEVIDIVNNKLFSPTDEQKKLTGNFKFSEYEIIKISNMEIPFTYEVIKNDEIIVETNRQFIFGRHISTYHENWCSAGVLGRWYNGRYDFGGVHIDGIGYANEIFYYFVDYDTIIYEHHLTEAINENEKRFIQYKIIFKREKISE